MPGPHVLLSSYAVRVISCGIGVLSSWSPFLGCLSGSSELGLSGAPPYIRRESFYFWMHSSSWPLPRLGALGTPCYVFQWPSFQERRWVVLCFHHRLCGEDSGPSLAPRFAGFTVPAQPTRDNRNGRLLYPVRAVRCSWSALAAHHQRCDSVHVAAGCSMEEGLTISVSFWLRMPLARGCWLSVTERSVLRPLSSVRSCCRSVSSLWRTCCHTGGRVWMWCSRSSLWGYYLGAVAPSSLAAFHRVCVVAERSLVWPGPAHLDISLLMAWRLVLGPCFLVRIPPIRRLPMGWHGWGFVYISTFGNVVCIISWKYWISFLRNLSFLLQ